ncbi:hypothetical protein BDD43_5738 [Mucilaginibacter gracilis]|uniref:Uncharacterized protein n=1 Tax=Mucilaginibacter gracilis TaxID=423350 RepID=A0A495J985_9SPHI|nr:hypothetical protein [Mucilaginibacter gracilis]RKR85467.1 hypothetical protein BDD43_5738 [Mucilaginibacter gracilis]
MPQITINYKKPETLKILKSLSKYLDFAITSTEKADDRLDDILVPGDKSLDVEALSEVITGMHIDAKELRRSAWKR